MAAILKEDYFEYLTTQYMWNLCGLWVTCILHLLVSSVFQNEAWTCVLPQLQRPDSTDNLALRKPAYLSSTSVGSVDTTTRKYD